jgi:hypothetical protein
MKRNREESGSRCEGAADQRPSLQRRLVKVHAARSPGIASRLTHEPTLMTTDNRW